MADRFIYAVVRTDLSVAQQIVQVLHAGFEVGRRVGASYSLDDIASVCLFEVADERELIEVSRELGRAGVRHRLFLEEDNDRGYTALVTVPLSGEQRRPLWESGYRLYGATNLEGTTE